ncbi:MAG: (d)CMP kinase [Proteobacteria bacterium]|nr:(d)CMP kinase [Pseudomonadota bacterium]
MVVAIDGPAGAGKSTVARRVAQRLGALLLDSGAIYRALAVVAQRRAVHWQDEQGLAAIARELRLEFRAEGGEQRVFLVDGAGAEDVSAALRTPEIAAGASAVSRWPAVREALLVPQRAFAEAGAVVAEGRDTGTVVFPRAAVKIFLVADPVVRAERRSRELCEAGHAATVAEVLSDQQRRDDADTSRAIAPLRAAHDAVRIDTSRLTIDEVVQQIVALCASAEGGAPAPSASSEVAPK